MLLQKNKQQGFTLVETLIAILIFSISLAGLSTIAARGVSGARGAANEIIAQYLAQEGVERVRFIRDTNYAEAFRSGTPIDWLDGISQCDDVESGCHVTFESGNGEVFRLIQCLEMCPPLQLRNGLYTHENGDLTPFTRTIVIDVREDDEEVDIISRVSWRQGGLDRVIEVTETMVHWQNI